jgi:hypothetical protein
VKEIFGLLIKGGLVRGKKEDTYERLHDSATVAVPNSHRSRNFSLALLLLVITSVKPSHRPYMLADSVWKNK